MAKVTSVNNMISTIGECLFIIKTTLKNAGWTVPSSSDGTTYNSSGDQITTNTTGAGGMDNNFAWFRIRDPGGRREFTFQRTNSGLVTARIKYSALARFTGGSPGATQTPSATDESIVLGAGTDASPTFAVFISTALTYYFHIIAQNSAEGNTYGFWIFSVTISTGVTNNFLFLEPLRLGSANNLDQDQAIVYRGTSSLIAAFISTSTLTSNAGRGWYLLNLSGAQFLNYIASSLSSVSGQTMPANTISFSPYDNKDYGCPIFYHRSGSTYSDIKGSSRYLRFRGVNRIYPEITDIEGEMYVYLDDLLVPWDETEIPMV